MPINLPNQITLARLIIAAVVFILLANIQLAATGPATGHDLLIWAAFILFTIAAALDALDGHLARRWNQTTGFGRVIDPFVDKMLVLGVFLFLLGPNYSLSAPDGSTHNAIGLAPWMLAILLARELLVSVLRGELEKSGQAFGANSTGKLKATLQFIAAGAAILATLVAHIPGHWIGLTAGLTLWAAVLITAASTVVYLWRARGHLRMHHRSAEPHAAASHAARPAAAATEPLA